MFKKNCIILVALFLGLTVGAVARAAGSAKAEIKTFNVQLIDLDTADGIAPAISYASQAQVAAFYGVYTRAEYHEDFRSYYGTLIGAYDSGVAVTTVEPGRVYSEAQSWGIDSLAFSSGAQTLSFWLTPNTSAIFTAQVEFDLERESGDRARGWAGMSGSVWEGPSFTDDLRTPASPLSYTASATLNGALESSGRSAMGELRLWTEASVLSAAPVPEAGTWGMLLAGLGVVGAAARSRRRNA